MFCSTESHCYRWDLTSKSLHSKYEHPNGTFYTMVLSSDDRKLLSNGQGANITIYDITDPDENQTPEAIDIIKTAYWVLFELSPNGNTLV